MPKIMLTKIVNVDIVPKISINTVFACFFGGKYCLVCSPATDLYVDVLDENESEKALEKMKMISLTDKTLKVVSSFDIL